MQSRPTWLPVIGHRRPDPLLARALRDAGLVAAWLVAIVNAQYAFRGYVIRDVMPVGVDAHAYWLAARSTHPYAGAPGTLDAYLYSPIFAQLLHPFALLPFPVFFGLWALSEALIFAWLVAPLRKRWAVPLWLLCVPEIICGNIAALLALAAVLAVRRPEAWSFPLLTKITPGGLGFLWHACRGEWRGVWRMSLASGLLIALSIAVDPHLWLEWLQFLAHNGSGSRGPGVVLRGLLGAALVVAGARAGRPWVLAPAILVSTPVLGGVNVLALLTALPRLGARPRPLLGLLSQRPSRSPRPETVGAP